MKTTSVKHFVWKLRYELVHALEDLSMVDEQDFPSEEKSSYVSLWKTDQKVKSNVYMLYLTFRTHANIG